MIKTEQRRIIVLEQYCKGCELCVSVCPRDVLQMSSRYNDHGHAVVEVVNHDACTSCRLCALSCPDLALEVWKP